MAQRLTAGEQILRSITEADFQSTVISQARRLGWLCYWPPPNRPGRNGAVASITPGWPDLAFVRSGDFFLAELKKMTGKTSPEQDKWIGELRKAGLEVHVWRPSDQAAITARLTRPRLLP